MNIQSALSGVMVLDLSRMLPGPYCTTILADHGARVITIAELQKDKPDVTALPIPTLNRNKELIRIDLKQAEGKEVFYRLCEDADVIVEGFRPGVTKKLGIDYDSIRSFNCSLIYCSITGYGQAGPRSGQVGHDLNYLGMSGVLDLLTPSGAAPRIPALQFADLVSGMNAALGILLALFRREITGLGQHIDIAMADSVLALTAVPFTLHHLEQPFGCGDSLLSHGYACYDVYRTADDRYVTVAALEPKFFAELCRALGLEPLIPLQYQPEQQDKIRREFQRVFLTKRGEDWQNQLESEEVCVSLMAPFTEALTDKQFQSRSLLTSVNDGAKQVTLLGIPIKLSLTPGSIRQPPPKPDKLNTDLLLEFGYSLEQIKQLCIRKIVG